MLSLISRLRCRPVARRRRFGAAHFATSQTSRRSTRRRHRSPPGPGLPLAVLRGPDSWKTRTSVLQTLANLARPSLSVLQLAFATLSKIDTCYCTLTPRRPTEATQLARRGTPAAVSSAARLGAGARAARQASPNARRRINKSQTPARCPATPSPRTSARAGPRSKYSVSRRTR